MEQDLLLARSKLLCAQVRRRLQDFPLRSRRPSWRHSRTTSWRSIGAGSLASSPCRLTSGECSVPMGAAASAFWAAVGCWRVARRICLHVGGEGWVVGPRVGACTLVWALSMRISSGCSMPDVLVDGPRGPVTRGASVSNGAKKSVMRVCVCPEHV